MNYITDNQQTVNRKLIEISQKNEKSRFSLKEMYRRIDTYKPCDFFAYQCNYLNFIAILKGDTYRLRINNRQNDTLIKELKDKGFIDYFQKNELSIIQKHDYQYKSPVRPDWSKYSERFKFDRIIHVFKEYSHLTEDAKKVLYTLAYREKKQLDIYQREIADMLKITRERVINAIKELERTGYIIKENIKGKVSNYSFNEIAKEFFKKCFDVFVFFRFIRAVKRIPIPSFYRGVDNNININSQEFELNQITGKLNIKKLRCWYLYFEKKLNRHQKNMFDYFYPKYKTLQKLISDKYNQLKDYKNIGIDINYTNREIVECLFSANKLANNSLV